MATGTAQASAAVTAKGSLDKEIVRRVVRLRMNLSLQPRGWQRKLDA